MYPISVAGVGCAGTPRTHKVIHRCAQLGARVLKELKRGRPLHCPVLWNGSLIAVVTDGEVAASQALGWELDVHLLI